jgi:hypothetical protein
MLKENLITSFIRIKPRHKSTKPLIGQVRIFPSRKNAEIRKKLLNSQVLFG